MAVLYFRTIKWCIKNKQLMDKINSRVQFFVQKCPEINNLK